MFLREKNSRTDETKNADYKGRCLTPNNVGKEGQLFSRGCLSSPHHLHIAFIAYE